jgi:inosine-uridine nucleoside N-ribohydrolase
LAVGVAIDPEFVGMEKAELLVTTEKGEYLGQMKEVPRKNSFGENRINVGFTVETEKFLELFISRLKG